VVNVRRDRERLAKQRPGGEYPLDELGRRMPERQQRPETGEGFYRRPPGLRPVARQADLEVEPERLGDLLVEELTERTVSRVDMADDLLHVQPERHPVIAVARSRDPSRPLSREQARD